MTIKDVDWSVFSVTQISNNLWTGPSAGSSVVSSCMIPRGSPPCVTSPYPHSPRAAEHGYVGFPNHQQNQFGVNHVSLNNFFADSLLASSANSHAAFETKPEFERRSSSIAVLRMKAKEHTANISWAMWRYNYSQSQDFNCCRLIIIILIQPGMLMNKWLCNFYSNFLVLLK